MIIKSMFYDYDAETDCDIYLEYGVLVKRKRLSPSNQCKEAGLESFSQLVKESHVPKSTLLDWYKNNQDKFTLAIDGVLWRLNNKENKK